MDRIPRTLLAALALLFAVLPADSQRPREVERTAARFGAALEEEDWPRAIELGRRLVELSPANHVHPYNLACAYARSGDRAAALDWLERAAGAGFSDPEQVRGDEDLEQLRGEPRYRAVVDKVEANERRARELFRRLAADSEPAVFVPEGEGPHPVLVVLHGYGGSTDGFFEFFRPFAERHGFLLIAPRSIVPTPGGGFEWATSADAGWLVEQALERVGRNHAVDGRRVYLLGFSQGGQMAFEVGLDQPGRFRGVIPIASRPRQRAVERAAGLGASAPAYFLMAGGLDPAAEATEEAARVLKQAGVDVRYQIYSSVGHQLPPAWQSEVLRAVKFFEKE